MCGIVGAVAQRDVSPILLEGLKRLEYRGYDSAGMAVLDENILHRHRALGKVAELEKAMQTQPLIGSLGIAHTRWATHGIPAMKNAHPHMCNENVAIVHNGIIENHAQLRTEQLERQHDFSSDTDTEVIVHEIHDYYEETKDLLKATVATIAKLEGAYALGVITKDEPGRLVTARKGSPLVIGVGIGEYFIASDVFALLPVTQRFIFLEDGDVADITTSQCIIYDVDGNQVEREIRTSELSSDATDKGEYRHYMLKEIFEQARVVNDTLEGRVTEKSVMIESFGVNAQEILEKTEQIQIVACGTSYHAGLVAKYWFESFAQMSCNIEVASEFRYRPQIVKPNTLFVTISQSGETADTLAALKYAKECGYEHTFVICNVPESSLVRESDLALMTRAGPEIGVASTKAFTTQLVTLLLLVIGVIKLNPKLAHLEEKMVSRLITVPRLIEESFKLDDEINALAEKFADKHHALFLGRGAQYPVAMEGALKLKEISYIHAEAYPAGELKHGPLALIDDEMPVIVVAPNDQLLEKLKSNLQEVKARGGELYVFADSHSAMDETPGITIIRVAEIQECIAPIIFTIPLQLFAYHVAVLKGTDVDQPRNLAKSVTVE
ncbi:MAG: glutamine--fructose-6-phosphate transaminase (isomerizing) [Methylococcales bacterium]|mgnify:CR=1 FL=1|jgi:glutamine---fructose-6-phosphate transaminase (isomerizing)|nr:glutamine--fructose-6-phosphate transaminase (isomerizing) [Methylococcales bacterium]